MFDYYTLMKSGSLDSKTVVGGHDLIFKSKTASTCCKTKKSLIYNAL